MKRSPLQIVGLVVLGIVVLVLLFTVVFPWVESNTQDPTLGTGVHPQAATAGPGQAVRAPR